MWLYVRMTSAEVPQTTGADPVVKLLKAWQVADILGVKPHAVTQLCRDGILPATRPMKAWLIHPADLQAYLDAHRNTERVSA